MAEGMGFEPMVMRNTTTVFETVPFVHSGNLPPVRVAPAVAAAICRRAMDYRITGQRYSVA